VGRRSSLLAIGAVLVAGGAGLAAYGATRPKAAGVKAGAVDPGIAKVEADLDARLAAEKQRIEERAQELAGKAPVQYAVGTDASTTANMSYADLMFAPAEREIVELGQIVGGVATSLTVLPATAPRTKHLAAPGIHVGTTSGELVLTQVAPVEPADRKGEVQGRVAVTITLDVAAETAPLRQRGIAARIDTEAGAIVIGSDPGTGARSYQLGLGAMPATLVTAAPPGAAAGLGWLLWPGVAGAALGLILLVVGMRARPAAAAPAAQPGPSIAHVDTQLSPAQVAAGNAMRSAVRAEGTPNPADGPVFGRYQLVRKLGSGGMADVHLARAHGEAGFTKLVALKLLHSHLATRPQAMAHFLDEARLASNLNHPNIVQIIDLGKVETDYYIAMEYVEGSDLERIIQAGRAARRFVPMPIAMTILRRVCDGLDAAHRAVGPDGAPLNIVHRDVKSGNVLVSRQGQVKISDFGIAKASSQVHTTQIGETKGTPSVMAPEQRMGQLVDRRADVYAVAALGYELFTSAEMNLDLVQLAQLGIDGWPHLPKPSEIRGDLPRELDAVLIGALAFSPDARPASCHDLEEALAQIAAHHGLVCSDKDIARWLDAELPRMPGTPGAASPPSPPPLGVGA
jgi:hypothetical protein